MKVNKFMLVALAMVVFVAGYVVFFSGKKKVVSVPPPIQLPSVGTQADVRIREAKPGPEGTNVRWERDPFVLPKFLVEKPTTEKKKSAVKLLAIMEGRKGRVAIVDNEVVSKGDVIGGELVQEIGKDRIVLTQDGSKRVITMGEAR